MSQPDLFSEHIDGAPPTERGALVEEAAAANDAVPERAVNHHVGQWRLARIEVVNWGTFSGRTSIDVARQGHLFTGASGSGKSSLLDAIAVVLTPDGWLRLNAAAQDGTSRRGDRTLMSYVRGAWTKEIDESLDRASTVFLRQRATWSGIALRFENLRDEPITLVRLFHAPGTRTENTALKNARIFHRGDLDLLTLQPFVEGGIDARKLKSALPEALVTTASKHGRFHERVRRSFGFRSETTLNLLHKTQSAKNLGTLDALFRGFMLDAPETFDRADNAVEQFTELDLAHQHVLDLRNQAAALMVIDQAITAYDDAGAATASTERLLEAVEPYTQVTTLKLAHEDLGPAEASLARAEARRVATEAELEGAQSAKATAEALVRKEGGARVDVLRARIDAARDAQAHAEQSKTRLADELELLRAPMPRTAAEFAELLGEAKVQGDKQIEGVAYQVRDDAAQARAALARIKGDLAALRTHRSNLQPGLLAARAFLAQQLNVPESGLPFAGELIAVLPEHSAWRGAIERVLAPLARTLLVPIEHIGRARRAANSRHFGTRLVIEAVPTHVPEVRRPRDARSLIHRVAITDSGFAPYLRGSLYTKFDYACVDGPDDLDGVERGVTIAGLVKGTARRYIKDDRSAVDDPTRWVLGGDTEARLEALLEQLRAAEMASETAARAERRADDARDEALQHRDVYQRIRSMTWAQIDTDAAARAVAAYQRELDDLTATSRTLREAQEALERANGRLKDASAAHERAIEAHSQIRGEVDELTREIAELEAQPTPDLDPEAERVLEARFREEGRSLTRRNIESRARSVNRELAREKEEHVATASAAGRRFTAAAAQFGRDWEAVVAAAELTVEIEDRYGYRDLRAGIVSRGLPEKEGEFRRLLRERSRDVIAHLLDDLRNAPELVRDRVLPVNSSLATSPFEGTDTFLEIDVKTTRSHEVEEFLADLGRIVAGNWADESAESAEERFAVLKAVIGRLRSKDGVDVAWRNRVLDTRLHVSFLAREVDSRGVPSRVYDSSEGLSGGQRQKLVIFCLGAALRYQLTDDEHDFPKFGSILLDEAFDKADSTYTRNAMDVFQSFGFHMILATPQKLLQTLEPYVGAITAVSNPDRNQSVLQNVVYEEPPSNGVVPGPGR